MSYSRNLVKEIILDHVITIRQHDALRSLGLVSLPFSAFIDIIYQFTSPTEGNDKNAIIATARTALFLTVLEFAEKKVSGA